MLTIAAMLALAVPTLALAQGIEEHHGDEHRGEGPRDEHRGPPPGAMMAGPHPGGPAAVQFSYHGHMVNRLHEAPFVYPHGFAYRRWAVGAALPRDFLAPTYYYAGWGPLGLTAPPPGFQWVRFGPDLLLVNTATGQVEETAYDVFY
jgi:Ni/Co efflux regulator RcnB